MVMVHRLFTVVIFITGIILVISSELTNNFLLSQQEEINDSIVLSSILTSLVEWQGRKRFKLSIGHRQRRDEEMVCYRDLGCFRDEGPFDYLDTLPASPKAISTSFVLYTRINAPKNGELISYENTSSIINSTFNFTKNVKVIIHGFGSSGKRYWVKQMAEALLINEDVNVIIVDWEKGASLPNYVQAAANSQLVAKQLAKLIKVINQETNINCSMYHLIGFSLGAHIAGQAGMTLQQDGIGNISRITGLDPASPLFEGYSTNVRLDPADAQFVDVIHSNADSLLRLGLGFSEPMGHVDFYPNGGRIQLGCQSNVFTSVTDIFTGNWNSLCNHRRAFRFFIDSIVSNCTFGAFSCDTYENYLRGECFNCGKSNGLLCSNMGYYANQSPGRGIMYLVTRDSEPFCANQYRIKIINSKGQGSTWGKLELTVFSQNGYNETFVLANDEEITDNTYLQGLLVAHPKLINITYANITYYKYKGWIYSGKDTWLIDKIEINFKQTNKNKITTVSNCNRIELNDTIINTIYFINGNCTIAYQLNKSESLLINNYQNNNITPRRQQRIARLFWQLIAIPNYENNNINIKRLWNVYDEQREDNTYYIWSPFW